MTDKVDYFLRAESWAVDNQEAAARSRRVAWTVAGAAAGLAMLEAVALAMLMPLKTVQPITLLVDRQTGYVQALDPVRPRRIAADEALTQALLAQYVSAREGFDRATISADYRRVALWSGGRARQSYLADMPASNPASPFQRYPARTVIAVRVKSVSKLNEGTALVRFDTFRQDSGGLASTSQPWVSVIRYRFVDAPMPLQDRFINPLGFQVIGYRRDAEAPPPALAEGEPVPWASSPPQSQAVPARAPQPAAAPTMVQLYDPRNPKAAPRTVPMDHVPLGSPLVSGSDNR